METTRAFSIMSALVLAAGLSFSTPAHAQESCDETQVSDDVLDSGTSSAMTMSQDFTDNFSKSAGSASFGSIDPETSSTDDLHSKVRTEERPIQRVQYPQWPDDLD